MEKKHKRRDYQTQATDAVMENLQQSNHRILLQIAAGAGKTSVLVQLVETLQHYDNNASILILTSRQAIKDQITYALQNSDVFYNNTGFYNAPVVLSTYSKTHSELKKVAVIPYFRYVLCFDGEEAIDPELEVHFSDSFLIGIISTRDVKKGWFKNALCVFDYSIEKSDIKKYTANFVKSCQRYSLSFPS